MRALLAAASILVLLTACSPEDPASGEARPDAAGAASGDHDAMDQAAMDHEGAGDATGMGASAAADLLTGPQSVTVEADGQNAMFAGTWIRTPPQGRDVAAGYLVVRTQNPDAIVEVTSPDAERVELHTMTMDDNVMRMRRIDRLETGPEPVRLAPGSDHLMIFGLSESARTNAAARLTLTFESGLVAEELVFPIEDAMPE
ncbi:copper chaperone PCu(A)C [Marinicauda pacifica]|jgi:copper(I)-binding protein|uniref:copper chaperone PCu(A)C n=1 Tax=Marinicauda pacifica TaxID=1133559 RepID=UPI0035C80586